MATLSERIWARLGRKQSTEKRGPISAWNASASTISTSSSGYLSGSVSSGINSQSLSAMNLYRQCSIESVGTPPPVVPEEVHRRASNSSNSSKLNQYIAAASAWEFDWEDEDDEEFDTSDEGDPSTPGSPTRWMWAGRIGSTSSAATPDDLFETVQAPEPSSSSGNARSVRASVSSTSKDDLQLNRMQLTGASCPALDQIEHKKRAVVQQQQSKKSTYKKNSKKDKKIAQSSLNLGQVAEEDICKKAQGKLVTSKSMGCIPNNDIPPIIFKFKKPVTYRFTPSGLSAGSKIIWMSENGDFAGKVHWVGKLRDIFHAGVEFEAPMGNSSGIYGYGHGLQTRLFTCKLGYGRFVPVDQLILYEDYYEGQKTGFICIICRDDFVEPGQQDCLDSPDKIMVATKCGHLFHQTCLNQWFNEKPCTTQQCPFCQRTMDCNETIRIFPAQYK